MLFEDTIEYLFHITHIENIPSILEHGILSHNEIKNKNINFNPIFNIDVIKKREEIHKGGRNLLDNANLYFNPRNPMMCKIAKSKLGENISVLCINKNIAKNESVLISDGNAASWNTEFNNYDEGIKLILNQWSLINSSCWDANTEQSRAMMAECLVPNMISPKHIEMIYVPTEKTKIQVEKLINSRDFPVIVNCRIFFKNTPI